MRASDSQKIHWPVALFLILKQEALPRNIFCNTHTYLFVVSKHHEAGIEVSLVYLFTLCADSVVYYEFVLQQHFYTKNNHEKVTLFLYVCILACMARSFYHELCSRYSFMISSILLMTQPNQMPHLCISNDHEIYINT